LPEILACRSFHFCRDPHYISAPKAKRLAFAAAVFLPEFGLDNSAMLIAKEKYYRLDSLVPLNCND
jgi:hypothetical protein